MRSIHRPLLLAAGALALSGAAGCGFLKSLAGENTISLEKANVKSMSVDIRKTAKTICPREPVQMAVFVEAVLEDEKETKRLQTWAGKEHVNKNDKLDFAEFAFHSELGKFDESGWFTPNPSLLASTEKEFELISAFKRRPDKFTLKTKYKPDYNCIKEGGGTGAPGHGGSEGNAGQSGTSGSSGSATAGGSDGSDGGAGGPGGNGTEGGPGPKVQAYATMVKTAYYDKLIALKITGSVEDFLLFPPEAKLSLKATGGNGGRGGSGGHGGPGGSGGSGNPGGNGGKGGPGGNGGNGGNGGPGGSLELAFDGQYAELASAFKLDASGGASGEAGAAGPGGSAGSGGGSIGQGAQSGQRGTEGPRGAGGSAGQQGPNGQTTAHAGKVDDQFANLSGVTLLSADSAAAAPAEEPEPIDNKKGKGKGDKKDKGKPKKDDSKSKSN